MITSAIHTTDVPTLVQIRLYGELRGQMDEILFTYLRYIFAGTNLQVDPSSPSVELNGSNNSDSCKDAPFLFGASV